MSPAARPKATRPDHSLCGPEIDTNGIEIPPLKDRGPGPNATQLKTAASAPTTPRPSTKPRQVVRLASGVLASGVPARRPGEDREAGQEEREAGRPDYPVRGVEVRLVGRDDAEGHEEDHEAHERAERADPRGRPG